MKKRSLLNDIEMIKRSEKRKKSDFAELPRNFYRDVVEEIERMQIEAKTYFEKDEIEKGTLLTEEIKKAKSSLEELVAIRIRKMLIAAVSENMNVKNLTREEIAFYEDIRELIESFTNRIMGKEHKEEVEVVEEVVEEKVEEKKEENYILARVVAPYVEVLLPSGKNLKLKKEDVLHIPEKIYRALLKREKVEAINVSK